MRLGLRVPVLPRSIGKGNRNQDDLNQWSSKYDLKTPGVPKTLLVGSGVQNYFLVILRCHLSFLLTFFCEHTVVNIEAIDGGSHLSNSYWNVCLYTPVF